MKRFLKKIVVVAGIFFATGNVMSNTTTSIDVQDAIYQLSRKLSSHQIFKIEILWVSPQMQFRNEMTADDLDKQFRKKIVILNIESQEISNDLINEVKSINVKKLKMQKGDSMDLRFSVKFFESATSMPVTSLYFDRGGDIGLVNGTDVTFDSRFYKWLDKEIFKKFTFGNVNVRNQRIEIWKGHQGPETESVRP